jgi:hypothetical protein
MNNYNLTFWAEDYVNKSKDSRLIGDLEPSQRTLKILAELEPLFNEDTNNPS